jgi:hypothetical protein
MHFVGFQNWKFTTAWQTRMPLGDFLQGV